jgi:hypothetical protein
MVLLMMGEGSYGTVQMSSTRSEITRAWSLVEITHESAHVLASQYASDEPLVSLMVGVKVYCTAAN